MVRLEDFQLFPRTLSLMIFVRCGVVCCGAVWC